MGRAARRSGLTVLFAVLLGAALAGQALSGRAVENARRAEHGEAALGLGEYLVSSHFAVDVAENWQSEYLQFLVFILATVWLVQRGSHESKAPGRQGRGTDAEQLVGEHATARSPRWARAAGWRRAVYSSSLGLAMGVLFVLSWAAQYVAGRFAYNETLRADGRDPLSWAAYAGSADFWNRTTQNWQSSALAVVCLVVLTIHLRQRGSPVSKAVGAPHRATGAGEDG